MAKNKSLYERAKNALKANYNLNELRDVNAAVRDEKIKTDTIKKEVHDVEKGFVGLKSKQQMKKDNAKSAWQKYKDIAKVLAVTVVAAGAIYGGITYMRNKNNKIQVPENTSIVTDGNKDTVPEQNAENEVKVEEVQKGTSHRLTDAERQEAADLKNSGKVSYGGDTQKTREEVIQETNSGRKEVEGETTTKFGGDNQQVNEDKQVIEDAKKDQNKEVKDLNENVTSVTKKDNTTEQKKAPENNYEKKEETKVEVKEEKTQEVKSQEKQEKSEAKAYSNEIDTQQQKAKEDQQKQQADLDDWLMGR